MEEIDTIFSDDHSFFQEAMMRKGPRLSSLYDDDNVEDFENDPSIYDPPSKICGGAVFSKLRSFGSGKNSNSKISKDHNFDKKNKKKVQYNPQVNKDSPKLINNKPTDKMKKRKNKKSDITSTSSTSSTEENPFRQSVSMQDSTTLSSISNPSLSSSPWVTEDDVDDFFDRQKREIMGESTEKYTSNQSSSGNANHTDHSRQTLQSLLKEMKNLNGIVQENSSHLRKGIENIAFELEQENNKSTPQKPRENDESELEQLRQERSYYRTEAETLRMEMKDIKEQLSEIRKFLPQMGKSFDIPVPPKSIASTTVVSSEASDSMIIPMYMGEAIESAKSSEEHARFLETIDYPPVKDPKLPLRSEVREILLDSERSVSDSERRARSAITRRAMKNAKEIIQQHHEQPLRTSHDVEEGKPLETHANTPPTPKAQVRERSPSPMNRSVSPISRRFQGRSISPMSHQSSIQSDLTIESRKNVTKDGTRQKQEGRKNSDHVEFKKNYYKNKIRKKYNIRDYPSERNDEDSSRRCRSIVSNESEPREGYQLVTADKKYREMRRSLHKRTASSSSTNRSETPLEEITTVNDEKESLMVYHAKDQDLKGLGQTSCAEGDIDEKYLQELRKSWYQRRGLALADSNSSEENRGEC